MTNTRVPVLPISGGDVAGKSRLIESLESWYGNLIIFVPEMASPVYGDSANPFPDPDPTLHSNDKREWLANFQRAIALGQVVAEAAAQQQARKCGAKLIICDRGILDHWAFLTEEQLPEFMRTTGLSVENAIKRYDSALYLESLAVSDPDRFIEVQGSNPHRRPRSVQEAIELEKLTRKAWNHHPKLHVIEGRRLEESHFEQAKWIIESYVKAESAQSNVSRPYPWL